MCTVEKALEMYRRAKAQHLRGAELLADSSKAACHCNGIGPAWFPYLLRWAISKLHPTLVPTSWVHDMEYQIGGNWFARLVADWHWLCNGCRAAVHVYAFDQLRRYAVLAQTVGFFVLLRIAGQPAFNWQSKGGRHE